MGELRRASSAALRTHWRLNADCSWKAGNENPPKRVQPPVMKKGARWAGWAAGGPAKQAQASGSMAASLEIYSIKVGSLPGGFHQLHDLSRQLDLVQKPPLQIAIRGADWARNVCCLWHLSSSVSYTFPLCCSLPAKGVIPSLTFPSGFKGFQFRDYVNSEVQWALG